MKNSTHKCKNCSIILTSENWNPSRIEKRHYICKNCINEKSKKDYENKKKLIFETYGNKCENCEESNPLYLTVDHKLNDGAEHRKEMGRDNIYNYIIKNNFPKDRFQLLCYNCNCAKDLDYTGYPYKPKPMIYNNIGRCFSCDGELGENRSKDNIYNRSNLCSECYNFNANNKRKNSNVKNKILVMEHYGNGECANCGIDKLEYLTLDHFMNDGAKQRKELNCKSGVNFYDWIIKNKYPNNLNLQVLCFNCNLSKQRINNLIII
jgi:hypothetical protein